MFKFNDYFWRNLSSYILKNSVTEVQEGLRVLEILINIKCEDNSFDCEYGQYLNDYTIDDDEWELAKFNKISEFEEKVRSVVEGVEEDVLLAPNMETDKGVMEIYEEILSYYANVCNHYKEKIEDIFFSNSIDYVGFATNIKKAESESKDDDALSYGYSKDKYVDLVWEEKRKSRDEDEILSCYKYIGEAGLGKTTHMRKMFWEDVDACISVGKKALPIWIELKKIKGEDTLKSAVQKELGVYADYYDELIDKHILHLYLDGYNEMLGVSETYKKEFATYLDQLHRDYPELFICITDRMENSVPACLRTNIIIRQFTKMSLDDIKLYAKKQISEKKVDAFNKAIQENSSWIEKENFIPEKTNMLLELFLEGIMPSNTQEFYGAYLDSILEREEVIKKETRLKELDRILRLFAKELEERGWTSVGEDDLVPLLCQGGTRTDTTVESLLELAVGLKILEVEGEDINTSNKRIRGGFRKPSIYKFRYDEYKELYL